MAVGERSYTQAGENFTGFANQTSNYVDVTFVTDTSILADGDVAANMVEIPNAVRSNGGRAILESFVLIDEDDQKIAADIVFAQASTNLGTLNSAPNISDANARANILGVVNVATGDYADLGGVSFATKRSVGLGVAASSGTSIYAGIVTRGGTPTYTASGLKMRLFFRQMS